MDSSHLKLQTIVEQLPSQHLEEVIDFAEFLAFKIKEESQHNLQNLPRLKRLEIPVIKGVKFIGDPLLRREDIYSEWER